MKRSTVLATMLLAACFTHAAQAQNPDPMDIRACTAIESDAQRLACYDHATGRVNLPAAQKKVDESTIPPGIFDKEKSARDVAAEGNAEVSRPLSLLDSRWELSRESKLGTFNVRGYKPVFITAFATSNPNEAPHSPNPQNTVTEPQPLQNTELKFQLSLKTKVWQGVFGDAGDVWVGYTQASHWQVFNKDISRPFRETNYEPEVMLVFNTHYNLFGWDGRLLGIGLNHESNGRADPLSRSWNRVIGSFGFERDGWTVMLRPWWRVPEDSKHDDNPNISDYMGRGDMQIVREWKGQEFGLMLRHSLRGGDRSHGAAQFTWAFPIAGNLRGYMELFKGYGESMIDYNHNATYLGLGVSLLDWY
ncbi:MULTISPECIES: phospholipase A [Dyella]|uniref:Phospholipase A1 n=2 Tax=Dyella TaxID=231454 RepID=A0A4R0Z1G9_9GAMM|nr:MULTISPECIES: phospholipase A [Dyella]TBR38965.1 phospholipase [Dyella terrae]TCI13444.1 phospholipase [Dyella soli]